LNILTSGNFSNKAGNGYHNVFIQILIMVILIGVLGAYSFFASRVMKMDGYSWPRYLWEGANYRWAFTDFLKITGLISLIGWIFQAIWFLITWVLWAIIWVVLVVLCGILYAIMYVGLPLHLAMLVVDFYCLISNKFIYKDDDAGEFYRRMEIVRTDKVIMIIAGVLAVIGIYAFTFI